jgi:SNW domain-containing protein 1
MATEAKAEQTKLLADKLRESSDEDEHEGRREREAFRADRRREVVREDRMARAGYRQGNREDDRDISEKVALGQAQASTKEAMYDQRLFNQA